MHDEASFRRLEEMLQGKVNDYALEIFGSLYRHNEWKLAIEELCDKVDDAEESLPPEAARLVLKLGEDYDVDALSFLALTEDIRSA